MSQPEQCWYIRTPIQPGEIFSSWLIRSALDVGCSPMVLVEALWGKWRALTIDLDKGVDAERFDALLTHSMESRQNIQQSMLSSVVSQIHPNYDPKQNIPWVLSLGIRNRSNTSGRQVCVECLKSRENPPYLRLIWRMGWHCSCIEHQVSLIDHCPECGATLQPFKVDLEHGCLAICTVCGFDLRYFEGSKNTNLNALNFQKKAEQVLNQKFGFYNKSPVTSQVWFEIARAWLSEIRFLVNTPNKNVIQLFESFDVNLHLPNPVTPLAFEYLNTQERIVLLSILDQIMDIPCGLLVQCSKEYGISHANFWDKRKKLPVQLQQTKDLMIKPTRHYPVSRAAITVTKPKSKARVQRQWLNLLRRSNNSGARHIN
ncbi:TniQ family protein [Acinetobacter baumannii]